MNITRNERHLINSEGLWAFYDGLTTTFLVAFALVFDASNTVIGLFAALPYIAILLSEIPGARLLESFSRLKVYGFVSIIGRLMWIGIIFAPFIFPKSPLLFMVVFYFLNQFFEYAGDPAWTTLTADVVPVKRRGNFSARRQRRIGIAGLVAMILGGAYLDLFTIPDLRGFLTMFAIGAGFGILSVLAILRVKEPKYQDHKHHGFKEYFRLEGDFKKFTILVFLFNFAFMLASPLIAAYMLRELALPYSLFALAGALALLSKIAVYKHVGWLSDKVGDKPVLFLSLLGTAVVPFLFLFIHPQTLWLIWPTMLLNGIVWAGYDVAIFNMFLDLTTPDKRAVQNASYMIITSVPMIVAPILGGFIADNLTFVLAGIPLVFAISAIFRAVTSFMLLSIPERRIKHEYPFAEVLHKAFQVHPVRGSSG